MTAPFWADFLY